MRILAPLLEVRAVKKYYPLGRGLLSISKRAVHAVDGVSLRLETGTTLGLVGESGSGKTTLGRIIVGLIHPTEGSVMFEGQEIFSLRGKEQFSLRTKMQIIFQNPEASLNPRKTVRHVLTQPFLLHRLATRSEADERAYHLLEQVKLTPPELYLDRYPHQLSGGQKQRVAIARAIALGPKLVVADEPVSSLDMSVKASVLKLMNEIQSNLGLSYFLISHDLYMTRSISKIVAVMYAGRIVELAETDELFRHPAHPYTQALLASTPVPDPAIARGVSRNVIGEPFSPIDPPDYCRFSSRCPYKQDKCLQRSPQLEEIRKDHWVECFFPL
ncbi:MAG: ABC transporter ATP-binding protein [Thaumarchaeota archaeon]|nr:ABC transporter ATP-binding protein [Nitrososphaerota archaeon]